MRGFRFKVAIVFAVLVVALVLSVVWTRANAVNWPDRRPIGSLFLASDAHTSFSNPRGWFNDQRLDVQTEEGRSRFRKEMLAYADRSIGILLRTNAQGMIAWDLEGEQYPHKVTYVGDPRLITRLAPETADVIDEFFHRFRAAGLKVGVTIRPQQLTFSSEGIPRQEQVWNYEKVLLDKIDYARKRWGATLFYIDSNGGPRWPLEPYRLQRVALQRPGVLLIPEHHTPLYYGLGGPYGSMRQGDPPTSKGIRMIYPNAFQVLALPDRPNNEAVIAAYRNSDIVLFNAWFDSPDSHMIQQLTDQR